MWFNLFCLGLIAVSHVLALKDFKILDIHPNTEKHSDLLYILSETDNTFDFIKLTKTEAQVLVSPDKLSIISDWLSGNEINFDIVNNDVLAYAIKESEENEKFCVASGERMGTDCYRSHDEINAWLDELQQKYPERVFVRQVGFSYEQRVLKTITITNGDGIKNKKVIFVDAGMHAREWISPSTGIYIIQKLVENFEQNKALLENFDWVVMPMINADGYEYTRSKPSNRLWRKTRQPYKTCTGADPNRNFDYMFGFAGTSTLTCMETYRGPRPFSEPETTVLRDVLLSLKGKISFYLTLHSHGSYLLYPWGYDRILAPNTDELEDVAQAGFRAIYNHSKREYQVGNAAILLYPAAGASDDYAYAVADARIAMTMELPSGGKQGFDPPPSDIKPYVEESWVGIVAMAEKVIEKYH